MGGGNTTQGCRQWGLEVGEALEVHPGPPNWAGLPSQVAGASPRLTPQPLDDS